MTEQHVTPDVASLVVGILGGTGEEGRGLARRLAAAGNPIIIGSRSAERATTVAAELGAGPLIRGMLNEDAARRGVQPARGTLRRRRRRPRLARGGECLRMG